MIEQKSLIQFLQSLPAGSPIILSACLLGVRCRYNAAVQHHPDLLEILAPYYVIPVCPEQLGGLPTPRPAAQIIDGDGNSVLQKKTTIQTIDGENVTDAFIRGANETANVCRLFHVKAAILQQRSPSCGAGQIYHGDNLVPGHGVTAALLRQMEILIFAID